MGYISIQTGNFQYTVVLLQEFWFETLQKKLTCIEKVGALVGEFSDSFIN